MGVNRIRVLLASPKGNISGGIARWTEHVLNYYNSVNNQPVQLSFYNTARKKQAPSGFINRLYKGIIEYSSLIWGLRCFMKVNNIDVFHFTSSASLGLIRDIIFIYLAQLYNISTVIHFRFGRTPDILKCKNWECLLLKYIVSIVDVAIFIDSSSYDAMKREGFDNIELLPNPISPTISTIIKKNGHIKREDRLILYVGHCYKEKGVYELVDACKSIPNLKLKLVGSIQNNIKTDLLKEGNGFLEICGEETYDRIIEDMLSCDIFVLPSYTEGFPNVILEAMACGCAIIATNVGAIPEMLDANGDGKCGIVIKPKNVNELKKALMELLDDNMKKDIFKKLSQQRVNKEYSMPVVWKKMEDIWFKSINRLQ